MIFKAWRKRETCGKQMSSFPSILTYPGNAVSDFDEELSFANTQPDQLHPQSYPASSIARIDLGTRLQPDNTFRQEVVYTSGDH